MTQCTGKPAEDWLEPYLDGTLPEMQQEQFEVHYFDCPVCLAQVQALQAVRLQLASSPVKAPKAPIPWPRRIVAIAAMLLIGFLGYRMVLHRPEHADVASGTKSGPPLTTVIPASPGSPAVSQLADLTLPAFQPSSLRGPGEDSAFQNGMKAYASADCHRALEMLSKVGAQDENALAAKFYSGVCQMRDGDLAAATVTLHRVADAGDSPQQEAAYYYLAQIGLAQNDVAAARRYLELTVALHGDFERRARSELASIPAGANKK